MWSTVRTNRTTRSGDQGCLSASYITTSSDRSPWHECPWRHGVLWQRPLNWHAKSSSSCPVDPMQCRWTLEHLELWSWRRIRTGPPLIRRLHTLSKTKSWKREVFRAAWLINAISFGTRPGADGIRLHDDWTSIAIEIFRDGECAAIERSDHWPIGAEVAVGYGDFNWECNRCDPPR